MNGASQPGGTEAAAPATTPVGRDLSERVLMALGTIDRLPAIPAALLIIALSLGLMALGGAVEYVVLSAVL